MKQTNLKISRVTSLLTLILTLFVSFTYAQALMPSITQGRLINWPMQDQLYPRNLTTNQATVPVTIRMVASTEFDRLQVEFYRDDNNNDSYFDPGELKSSTILPVNGGILANDSFTVTFPSYTITAELNQYGFVLRGIRPNNTSVLLNGIGGVVAGDVYIIQGQSNSYAENRRPGEANANTSIYRKFVKTYGSSHPAGFGAYPRNWGQGDGNVNNSGDYNVGMWGMRLGTRIAELEQIPVAIFCGGYGGKIDIFQASSTWYISSGGENNYRRLRRRLADAGVKDNVRGIFWWQGESDGIIDGTKTPKSVYISTFQDIMNSWKTDYPSLEKVFIIQIKLGCYERNSMPPLESALDIMQAQLELAVQNPDPNVDVLIFSTQNLEHILETGGGIPGTGWFCHYGYENGYRKAADLFLPTVRQELYGLPLEPNTRFGYPTAADFTSSRISPTQVTIELSNLDDSLIITNTGLPTDLDDDIRLYFRLEGPGGPFPIEDVRIENKRKIVVDFSNPNSGIPEYVSYFGRHHWGAPAIVNAGGQSVVAFRQRIEAFSLPIDPLSLTVSKNGGSNILRWKAENNERFYQFVIERGETRNNFKPIAEIYGTGQDGTAQYTFTDNKPNPTVSHYRIRAIQHDDKVVYSQVVTVNNRLNSVKEFRVFPNPVAGSANATIHLQDAAMATIHLHDASGRLLSSRKLQLQKGNNQFSLGELLDYGPGTYIVRVITPTETQQVRVVKAK